MARPSWRSTGALFTTLAFTAVLSAQTVPRPTPREAMDRALTPLREAQASLSLTDDERTRLRDVRDRGGAWAAELVEAEHHRDQRTVQARTRRIGWLARVMRSRVEAMRAQSEAARALTATTALRSVVAERRAARDRVSEALVSAERSDPVSTRRLPPPDVDAGVLATGDAATGAGR